MALVACPECGRQVSTEATSCPQCGKPLSATGAARGPLPVQGPVVFAPASTPGPEQSVWEGSPSIAVLYTKVLRLVLRFTVVAVIAYFALAIGLPSLAAISPDLGLLVDQYAQVWQLAIVVVLALVALRPAFGLAQAFSRIKSTHYRITNQRIVVESGVFSKSLEEIDMRSVDDIEFHQGLIERIFGIGQILIVSADKTAPRVVLYGIHDPRNTREMIRAAAYQVSQRELFTRST